jgi:hypothetical protein
MAMKVHSFCTHLLMRLVTTVLVFFWVDMMPFFFDVTLGHGVDLYRLLVAAEM